MIPPEYQVPLIIEIGITAAVMWRVEQSKRFQVWAIGTVLLALLFFNGHILNDVTRIYGGDWK